MADNTDEEHLDIPITCQLENPTDEITPTTDTDFITPNQETENMEVHHHPDLHHKPKKWKEFFLEFLMIFLAVSLGFIAENIREHITENKNAKILAHSLMEDVRSDTSLLHSLIIFSNKKLIACDSVLTMLHTPREKRNDTSFYRNMIPMVSALHFISTDGTYTQMKASGTLRYFKQSLVNMLNSYAVQLKKTEYRDDVEDKGIWILGNLNFDIINLEAMNDVGFKKPITHDMYVNLENKAITDKFTNLIVLSKGFRNRTLQEYRQQLKIAEELIKTFNKEYNLD